jgi:hypothetical protein
MFLVDGDNPGMTVGEHAHTIDGSMPGGHCRVTFDDCRVGPRPSSARSARASAMPRSGSRRLG